MDTWTKNFWIENEAECMKTLMEPENWKKVIEIMLKYRNIFNVYLFCLKSSTHCGSSYDNI